MTVHHLKIWSAEFAAVRDGSKTFEYRLNDRDFRVRDALVLHEWDAASMKYSGRAVTCEVTYVLTDRFGVPSGYAVLGLSIADTASEPHGAGIKRISWAHTNLLSHCDCLTGHYKIKFDIHEWSLDYRAPGSTTSVIIGRYPNRSAAMNRAQQIHEAALAPYLRLPVATATEEVVNV